MENSAYRQPLANMGTAHLSYAHVIRCDSCGMKFGLFAVLGLGFALHRFSQLNLKPWPCDSTLNPGGRCEIWLRPIRVTAPIPGHECWTWF